MIILSLTSEKQVFFRQERIGYHYKPFVMLKFSTMLKNSAKMGLGTMTLRNDDRVTTFGKFLRLTKLNELPQLVNIFIGEMSFVGPRPLLFKDLEKFPSNLKEAIYHSKPGLTGIGQIVFRDEEILVTKAKDPISFHISEIQPYKGELELWYLKNKSLILDLQIIFLTSWVIFFPQSILPYKIFDELPSKPRFLQIHNEHV